MIARFAGVLALAIDAGGQGMGVAGLAGGTGGIVAAMLNVVIGVAGDGAARGAAGVVAGLAAEGALIIDAGHRCMGVGGFAFLALGAAIGGVGVGMAGQPAVIVQAAVVLIAGMVSRFAVEGALTVYTGDHHIGLSRLTEPAAGIVAAMLNVVIGMALNGAACRAAGMITGLATEGALRIDAGDRGMGVLGLAFLAACAATGRIGVGEAG